ncbi:MAG TPA: NAD(P)/FAD-dependent oxidoreductase, partial [Solirubrobacteraceae bacterium]|nr:NAD(P)/FAD-dependent oxidoreductase [Solirubrobacteraceae bacterium]
IRTALYFGLACGRELRAVVEGRRSREQALARYGAFSAAHARKFEWMLRVQQAVGRITPSRSLTAIVRCFENRRLCGWVFDQYLAIAPPAFVADGPRALTRSRLTALTANAPASVA